MLSRSSIFNYILTCLQTNSAKSQISWVDIRMAKGGLDQGQTKNKLNHKLFKKISKFCLKDTVGKESSKKGHGIDNWLYTPLPV